MRWSVDVENRIFDSFVNYRPLITLCLPKKKWNKYCILVMMVNNLFNFLITLVWNKNFLIVFKKWLKRCVGIFIIFLQGHTLQHFFCILGIITRQYIPWWMKILLHPLVNKMSKRVTNKSWHSAISLPFIFLTNITIMYV